MASGVIDHKKNIYRLPFYKIGGLFKNIVEVATKDSILKADYQMNYQPRITRLSSDTLYAIDRLGWMIIDPLNLDLDVVLLSDGYKFHFVSLDKVMEPDFDRTSLIDEPAIGPLLTDEVLKYKESLVTTLGIGTGIIDEFGFTSSDVLGSIEDLGETLLMFDMMNNKELYLKYMKERNLFINAYEFLVSLPNKIAVKKSETQGYNVNYSNSNDEIREGILKKIDEESKDNSIISQGELLPDEIKGRVA